MTQHTPTPWGVTTYNGEPAVGRDTEEGGLVTVLRGDHEPATANAEFIVRAVNSHDELVAALEECAAVLEELGADGELGDMPAPVLDNARAALAKARG